MTAALIDLRRGETREWALWVNFRYRTVGVAHRDDVHLTRPGMTVTLCARRPVDALPDRRRPRLCNACRGGAKLAYVMRQPRPVQWRDGTLVR